jgi:diacylglycerol kinase (ATP)
VTGRRPLLLLVNPTSGGKPGSPPPLHPDPERLTPEALAEALRSRGLEVELRVLADGDDAGELAARAASEGRDVIAAGGDGTVAPAAAAVAGTDATLGVLALGSWNNIARGCGVPTELGPALEVIGSGSVVTVDSALAWHPGTEDATADGTGDPPEEATRFFEAAGVGLDAIGFVAAEVSERRGLWAGLRLTWRALRRRRRAMRLVIDGKEYRTSGPAVTVCNGPYHGMGFALAPDADPTDGLLDVVVYARMSAFALIRHYLSVARGRVRRDASVRTIRGRRILIAGTRRAIPVHADGRALGLTPIGISVDPASLRLFAQPRS